MGLFNKSGGGGTVLWLQVLCGDGLNNEDSGVVTGIRKSGTDLLVHGFRMSFFDAKPFLYLAWVVEKEAVNYNLILIYNHIHNRDKNFFFQ